MPITLLALAPLSLATLMPLVLVLALLAAVALAYSRPSVLMTESEMREACGREAWLPTAPTEERIAFAAEIRKVADTLALPIYMVETNPFALPWFINARNTVEAIGIVLECMEGDGLNIRNECPALWTVAQMGVMPPAEARIL